MIYQEPDNWRATLLELDRLNSLDLSDEWFPFREADIWIYFLKSEDELADIGGGVDALYRSAFTPGSTLPLNRRLDFEADNGRQIMLLFFFVVDSASDTSAMKEFVCKSTLSATRAISGLPQNSDLKKMFKFCPGAETNS